MFIFWIFMAGLVCIALGFVLYPTLRDRRLAKREGVGIEFYRKRLQELEFQYQHGKISDQLFHSYRAELESEFVHDLPKRANKVALESKRQDIHTTILLLIIIPLFATVFYHFWGHSKQLASWYHHEQKEKLIAHELAALGSHHAVIEKFKQVVQQHQSDPRAWYLLGRIYASDGQYEQAARSFAKANQLQPNDLKITLNYIQAMFFANHSRLNAESKHLLKIILGDDPANSVAINLLATDSFVRGHYQKAKSYWQALLPYYPKQSNDRKHLLAAIARCDQQLKQRAASPPLAHPSNAKPAQAIAAKATAPVESTQLTINITLADKLRSQLGAHDTLFVYAKAVNGPLFPLAVVRHPLKQLPTTVLLGIQQAMVPNATLADYDNVKVFARISHSAKAQSAPGDLQGETPILSLGDHRQQAVPLTINRIIQ